MKKNSEINEVYTEYGEAFLASKAMSLYNLIVSQGTFLLKEVGAATPSNCVSVVLLLESYDSLSNVQIAQKLDKSHQLISTRINRLEKLGLISRDLDKEDKRAKVISLTKEGKSDLVKIKQACRIADEHFQHLYRELDINIGKSLEMMEEVLRTSPLKKL